MEKWFAAWIAEQIQRKGLTRQELADRSGLTKRSIYYYEAGQRIPTLYTAERIAKALEVEITIGKKGEEN